MAFPSHLTLFLSHFNPPESNLANCEKVNGFLVDFKWGSMA